MCPMDSQGGSNVCFSPVYLIDTQGRVNKEQVHIYITYTDFVFMYIIVCMSSYHVAVNSCVQRQVTSKKQTYLQLAWKFVPWS